MKNVQDMEKLSFKEGENLHTLTSLIFRLVKLRKKKEDGNYVIDQTPFLGRQGTSYTNAESAPPTIEHWPEWIYTFIHALANVFNDQNLTDEDKITAHITEQLVAANVNKVSIAFRELVRARQAEPLNPSFKMLAAVISYFGSIFNEQTSTFFSEFMCRPESELRNLGPLGSSLVNDIERLGQKSEHKQRQMALALWKIMQSEPLVDMLPDDPQRKIELKKQLKLEIENKESTLSQAIDDHRHYHIFLPQTTTRSNVQMAMALELLETLQSDTKINNFINIYQRLYPSKKIEVAKAILALDPGKSGTLAADVLLDTLKNAEAPLTMALKRQNWLMGQFFSGTNVWDEISARVLSEPSGLQNKLSH